MGTGEVFLICFFVLTIGACIGSFLNVAALRAISGESIILPASKCPKCSVPIKWYDNIPVLSYFLTFRGRCRCCGCKVSIQYPIVEALTAILFLAVFIAFGISLKSLLLLVLLCTAIVISITDIKVNCAYMVHIWIFIVFALLYGIFIRYNHIDYINPILGIAAGVVFMELIARIGYFMIIKKSGINKKEQAVESVKEEELTIEQYIRKYKRVCGTADTYIAAGMGAMLGWKYAIFAVIFALLVQAVCIIPSFISALKKQKEYRILYALPVFFIAAAVYWVINILTKINPINNIGMILFLAGLAIYIIKSLRDTVIKNDYHPLPLGPALLISAFLTLFFGHYLIMLVKSIL